MVTITRNGTAYLPLHYGKPPELLYRKIVRLTGQICELISETYGTQELIWRMADPVWFHSLSLVTGFSLIALSMESLDFLLKGLERSRQLSESRFVLIPILLSSIFSIICLEDQ